MFYSHPILKYKFFERISNLDFVNEIYLFGSRARGTNREKSDIDIAISCPLATDRDWLKVFEIIEDADTLLDIDCIRLDVLMQDKSFFQTYQTEKCLLWKR